MRHTSVSLQLVLSRAGRALRPSFHAKVASVCRQVIDRCRQGKHDVKLVTDRLQQGARRFKTRALSIKPPGGLAGQFGASIDEFKFSRASLECVAAGYELAVDQMKVDSALQHCLGKLADVREKLAQQETVYYAAMHKALSFNEAFIASCDLRTATALSDQVTREVCNHLRQVLCKITALSINPIYELTGQRPFDPALLQLPSVVSIALPTVAEMVNDLTQRYFLKFCESGVFGQAVRDFTPLQVARTGAVRGVVMREIAHVEDSVSMNKGEIVQLLSQVHGFALVRRCGIEGNDAVGLVSLSAIRKYAVNARPSLSNARPQVNVLVEAH